MSRFVVVLLAILAVGEFADPLKHLSTKFKSPRVVGDKTFLKKQMELIDLYYHINEPLQDEKRKTMAETWTFEKNLDNYNNVTAVKIYMDLMQKNWILPRELPFSVYNSEHLFEAKTLFNVLCSSKNFDTFYKTAVYLRDRVNEYLFVYALGVATIHYPETQGIIVPPFYEIFPSYFFNGQIMTMAQRINTHGKRMVEQYPGTYVWKDNVVIRWNETVWPYYFEDYALSYFTNDHHLNALYYNFHLSVPFWLSGEEAPHSKFNRGEYFWFFHQQYLTHYYMERLSNGLGEIPELNFDMIEQGYESGLLYHSGIPFPSRPNDLNLKQPMFADYVSMIKDVESRIRSAIDMGYIVSKDGEKISIRSGESIDLFGKLIEGNVDSPNLEYYKDIISLWKMLLGNTLKPYTPYYNGVVPLVVPSALEQYQTTFRDPAFYMILNRAMKFFNMFTSYLPTYKFEELFFPSVKIEQVEVDKLVTYFENTYLNVTNNLYMNEKEAKGYFDDTSVLVQKAVLNHKPFNVRVHVKSDVAKKIVVKFFLAPKYNSKGVEIPLHENTKNFFQMDQFVYDLPAGETVIVRESNQNMYMIDKWSPTAKVYADAFNAYNGNGEFVLDETELFNGYPRRLMIPKGRVDGFPCKLMIYISEYVAPKDPYGTGTNPKDTFGYGTGSRRMTSYPLKFPIDRPLYEYQTKNVDNIFFQDVEIYHKPTPEMYNPFH